MRRRASTLLAALVLLTLIFILGLGFLSRRSAEYQVANLQITRAQARELAMAGLEDARAKLDRDYFFPPQLEVKQRAFQYAELVYDLDDVSLLGSYEVIVDQTYNVEPYRVITVQATGMAGYPPRSRYQVQAELDASPKVRGGTADNPDFWKLIRVVEQSQPQ